MSLTRRVVIVWWLGKGTAPCSCASTGARRTLSSRGDGRSSTNVSSLPVQRCVWSLGCGGPVPAPGRANGASGWPASPRLRPYARAFLHWHVVVAFLVGGLLFADGFNNYDVFDSSDNYVDPIPDWYVSAILDAEQRAHGKAE